MLFLLETKARVIRDAKRTYQVRTLVPKIIYRSTTPDVYYTHCRLYVRP
jgi:hypothetical protein